MKIPMKVSLLLFLFSSGSTLAPKPDGAHRRCRRLALLAIAACSCGNNLPAGAEDGGGDIVTSPVNDGAAWETSPAIDSGADSDTSFAMDSGAETGSDSATQDGGPNILGATPPMGWNSWNTFACDGLNESVVEAVADAMVSNGMKAAGYQYVNLDDCWMDGRASNGNIQWDASKFPNGISAVAQYVHARGLKFGLYSTPNNYTCSGIYNSSPQHMQWVGSLGHETQDAASYASWGVDYLKYDDCQGPLSGFDVMLAALRATGHSIFFGINPGNATGCPPDAFDASACSVYYWPSIANMWRIGFDISASWSSIYGLISQDAPLYPYAGPGHWNDPDVLEVGNGGLSVAQNQSHFGMWAMLAAPLLTGNDLRSVPADIVAILTNADIIAVDQDPLGKQGTRISSQNVGNGQSLETWSKQLSGNGVYAVALLNNTNNAASMTLNFSQIGLSGQVSVRDLWQHTDLGTFSGSYTAMQIPSYGVAMLRVTQ
jgi:alpha-galactosidase